MMLMNVFPIGSFFPRQDLVQPPAKSADAGEKVEKVPAAEPEPPRGERYVEMPLFSYRFL